MTSEMSDESQWDLASKENQNHAQDDSGISLLDLLTVIRRHIVTAGIAFVLVFAGMLALCFLRSSDVFGNHASYSNI